MIYIAKSNIDTSKLTQRIVTVTNKKGTSFQRRQWVSVESEEIYDFHKFESLKPDKKTALDYLKKHGITWKEDAHTGINWMRACMAAKNFTGKVQEKKVNTKVNGSVPTPIAEPPKKDITGQQKSQNKLRVEAKDLKEKRDKQEQQLYKVKKYRESGEYYRINLGQKAGVNKYAFIRVNTQRLTNKQITKYSEKLAIQLGLPQVRVLNYLLHEKEMGGFLDKYKLTYHDSWMDYNSGMSGGTVNDFENYVFVDEMSDSETENTGGNLEKQKYQMTQDEYIDSRYKNYSGYRGFRVVWNEKLGDVGEIWDIRTNLSSGLKAKTFKTASEALAFQHSQIVGNAIKDGKEIPKEVLKDYPSLKAKSKARKTSGPK